MTTTLVVCPECGSPVAPGRLSCQSCGMLLAAVVGAERRPAAAAATTSLPEIDEDRPLAAFMPAEAAPAPVRSVETPAPRRGPRRLSRSKPAPEQATARNVPGTEATVQVPEQTSIFGTAPAAAPARDWSEPSAGPASQPFDGGGSGPPSGAMPGAYLAPVSNVCRSAGASGGRTQRPGQLWAQPWSPGCANPAPFSPAAATWAAQQAMSPPGASNGTIPAQRGTTAPTEDTGRSIAEWLVIGGSTLAIVSFVLPWATDGVLGSNGIGYTAQWGLANGGHLLLVAAAAIVLLLHLGSAPVPAWIRTSVLPVAVGGLLAGVAFAYYARPFGGGTGVAVLLAGAVLMLVGGLLASRPGRNATGASTV